MSPGEPDSGGDFVKGSVALGGNTFHYATYLPRRSEGQHCPVVVYLHGKGRGGTDGMRQTEGGLGAVIRAAQTPHDFIAVFPQSPDDSEWIGPVADLALAVVDDAVRTFASPQSPLYLMGSSMGGHGVYHIGQEHAERFQRLVVSCGSPFRPRWRLAELGLPDVDRRPASLDVMARRLRKTPMWIFHGALDTVVPVVEARRTVTALRATGAKLQYTEYPDGGHELCRRPYSDPALWTWLFAPIED